MVSSILFSGTYGTTGFEFKPLVNFSIFEKSFSKEDWKIRISYAD